MVPDGAATPFAIMLLYIVQGRRDRSELQTNAGPVPHNTCKINYS